MAIQIPNPGTGNGATGDNEFVLWSKVKDNFTDQTNAASRLVGTAAGQTPLSEQTVEAANGRLSLKQSPEGDFNNIRDYGRFLVTNGDAINAPPQGLSGTTALWVVENISLHGNNAHILQKAYVYNGRMEVAYRNFHASKGWTEWRPSSAAITNYTVTTASGANVAVDSTGMLMRSTSSERYKDVLAPLELDDARYADAMALKPIVYRSTASADNPAYHYYSFSAEELGAYDPAFTLWRETETVTDADGNVTEQPLAERQAEGININALLAMSHAIAIKQDSLIKDLQEQVNALKPQTEV